MQRQSVPCRWFYMLIKFCVQLFQCHHQTSWDIIIRFSGWHYSSEYVSFPNYYSFPHYFPNYISPNQPCLHLFSSFVRGKRGKLTTYGSVLTNFSHMQPNVQYLACCADVIFFSELARVKKKTRLHSRLSNTRTQTSVVGGRCLDHSFWSPEAHTHSPWSP